MPTELTASLQPDLTLPNDIFRSGTTLADLETAAGPWQDWAYQCHRTSLAMVRSGLLARPARVARGVARNVGGQHSWVVLAEDCYQVGVTLLDPTLWSYDKATSPLLLVTTNDFVTHRPAGLGSIFFSGIPSAHGGNIIELSADLDQASKSFLDLIGPLDLRGWHELLHAPVQGWPAAQILAAAHAEPRLQALIPIDLLGMVTDLNPSGLYR